MIVDLMIAPPGQNRCAFSRLNFVDSNRMRAPEKKHRYLPVLPDALLVGED
jgi:hypothetical protein